MTGILSKDEFVLLACVLICVWSRCSLTHVTMRVGNRIDSVQGTACKNSQYFRKISKVLTVFSKVPTVSHSCCFVRCFVSVLYPMSFSGNGWSCCFHLSPRRISIPFQCLGRKEPDGPPVWNCSSLWLRYSCR